MFSVVIPLYNKERSVKNTIESVLNQTFQDFEVIVVNDGSTDNSLEVVKSFNDERIRIINQKNSGVSSARNRGIKEAKYDWIAFLDADDLWKNNHLQIVDEMINTFPNEKVFCTSFATSKNSVQCKKNDSVIIIQNYFKEALNGSVIWTSVAVIHQSVFKNIGHFNEILSRGEDLDMWARIGKYYRIIKSSTITALYVQDSENKLTKCEIDLSKSIVDHIDFNFISSYEKKYFQKLITNKIKSEIKRKNIKTSFYLLRKYNIKLII